MTLVVLDADAPFLAFAPFLTTENGYAKPTDTIEKISSFYRDGQNYKDTGAQNLRPLKQLTCNATGRWPFEPFGELIRVTAPPSLKPWDATVNG
jgi:hypothetical protein